VEWAEEIRQLLEEAYPHARTGKLVCDNRNTHHIASRYEACPPEQAHRLARRLEVPHTPRNGSWVNVAEIELSVLSEQCLRRRIPDVAPLAAELAAWMAARNAEGSRVGWRFTTEEARIKLHHLYPVCTDSK
jgi:hypothetical protein